MRRDPLNKSWPALHRVYHVESVQFTIEWNSNCVHLHLPPPRNESAYMSTRFLYLRTPPPNQLRRPRKPVCRAQHGDRRNKDREPQGEPLPAVWFAGWEGVHW